MIIIAEGIDRVGKTTLCNKLSTELNIPIFKKDRTDCKISTCQRDDILVNFGNAHGLIDAWSMLPSSEDLIIDRFYWTEYVYTKVQRDPSMSIELLKSVEDHMLMHNDKFITIYVRPTDIKWSSSMHGSDLSAHLFLFDKIFEQSKLHKLCTNYYELDTIFNIIKRRNYAWLDKRN